MVSEHLLTNVMASSSSSPTNSTVSNLPSFSDVTLPNYNFPFKLESDNYVIWKSQILPAIIGCNMEIFIDGTVTPPPTTIVETSNVAGRTVEQLVPNPEYRLWRRLDQALLAWILSLVSKDIRTQVSKVSVTFTSHQLWSSLERLFGSHCKAKLMQLCMQFQTTKKDSLSISSYFCKMKEIVDTLTMAGSVVSDEDFIL